jgi:hypothetical protein
VLAAAWWLDGRRSAARAAAAIGMFGAVPIAWIALHGGLSPEGTFVLDRAISVARLYRFYWLGSHMLLDTPIAALLLAAAGLFVLPRDRQTAILGAMLALFALAILFSAHGDPPDGERFVSTRETHLPLAMLLLAAALGCACYPRAAVPVAAMGVAMGIWGSASYVRHETSRPEIRLGYELARLLDARVQPGEQVLVLANRPDLSFFFRRARETGGESGLAAAHRMIDESDLRPLDVQRTLIHLTRISRERLWAFPNQPPRVDWVAVWSDFASDSPWSTLARDHPDAVLAVADRLVAVRRVP